MENFSFFLFHGFCIFFISCIALRLGKEALTSTFCLFLVLANLFVMKQIDFFSFTITSSDAYTIGGFLLLNFLQHFYGQKTAEKAILIGFFTLVIALIFNQFQLLYKPSIHDTFHASYQKILAPSLRINLASLSVGLLAQLLDAKLQRVFKTKWENAPLSILLFAPIVISQFFDTVAFSFIGLFGLMHNLSHIILISYLTKLMMIFCMSFFVKISKKWISKEDI